MNLFLMFLNGFVAIYYLSIIIEEKPSFLSWLYFIYTSNLFCSFLNGLVVFGILK